MLCGANKLTSCLIYRLLRSERKLFGLCAICCVDVGDFEASNTGRLARE